MTLTYRHLAAGQPLFHLFVIGALAFLLVETLFFGVIRRLAR